MPNESIHVPSTYSSTEMSLFQFNLITMALPRSVEYIDKTIRRFHILPRGVVYVAVNTQLSRILNELIETVNVKNVLFLLRKV